jgi:hypothetical protein
MIAPALVALALAAGEPAGAPEPIHAPPAPSLPAAEPPPERRTGPARLALAAGAFGSRLYGLPVGGLSVQVLAAHDVTAGGRPLGTTDLAFALDVGSTPEGLRVVHGELLVLAARRFGVLRLGAGLGLGIIEVERVTNGGGLTAFLPSLHGLAALDLPVPGPVRWAIQVQAALTVPYEGYDRVYPAFPRIAAHLAARL